MMISPETYIQEFEDKPYSALIQERHELLTELEGLEALFAHPEPNPIASIDPSPGLQYKMSLEYLAALTDLMRKRAGELTGEPDLEDDIECDLLCQLPSTPRFRRSSLATLSFYAHG